MENYPNICTHQLYVFADVLLSTGSKKNITKTQKNLARLYSSFSSEVLSVLFEFLLQTLDSSNLVELPKGCLAGKDMSSFLDDWKLVKTKFSKKEPELLLMLLKEVLNMIDPQEAMNYGMGNHKLVLLFHCHACGL